MKNELLELFAIITAIAGLTLQLIRELDLACSAWALTVIFLWIAILKKEKKGGSE